ARGVIGMKLAPEDRVIGVSIAHDDSTVLSVTENGFGKRTKIAEYRLQMRGGKGIINIKTTERNGKVVAMLTVNDDDEIVWARTDGIVIRTDAKQISTIGRNTQGVRLMKPGADAKVSGAAWALADTTEEQITEAATDMAAPKPKTDQP